MQILHCKTGRQSSVVDTEPVLSSLTRGLQIANCNPLIKKDEVCG